jgi:hypothetical protein
LKLNPSTKRDGNFGWGPFEMRMLRERSNSVVSLRRKRGQGSVTDVPGPDHSEALAALCFAVPL